MGSGKSHSSTLSFLTTHFHNYSMMMVLVLRESPRQDGHRCADSCPSTRLTSFPTEVWTAEEARGVRHSREKNSHARSKHSYRTQTC